MPVRRVGICAVAQTPWVRSNRTQRFQGMALEVLTSLLEQTGLDFSEDGGIDTAISVSDDVFDARTISDNAMTDVLGAHYRCEEKVAQDGAQAVYYGVATILAGHADLVLVLGHCKESQPESRNQVTHLAFDPFFTRPVGLDYLSAAGLQAQAYMARSDVTPRHLDLIAARARDLGRKNPFARDLEAITAEQAGASPLIADPLRALHCYPVTDGAIGMILASEERARKVTKKPVWITGVGNSMDGFYLGERDLASTEILGQAVRRAYERAGLTGPSDFDLFELSDRYAHELALYAEGLGLCEAGKAGKFIDQGGLDQAHVNPSGGQLAGNPLLLGGLARVSEAALQLWGKAGERQVRKAKRALCHGTTGPAGQLHTVITLESA